MKCTLVKQGKKWYVTYNEKIGKGKYNKIWIATGEEKKTLADKVLTTIQSKMNDGTFIKKDNITLKELFDLWIEHYVDTHLEKSTKNGYENIINKHIIPYFKLQENDVVQKIGTLDIDKYFEHLSKKGLSANTIHRHNACLRKAFKFAVKKQMINRSIMEGIDLPKKKKFKSSSYNEEQIQLLFMLLKDDRMEIPVHTGAGLGLRLSEVCGLRWEDVDLDIGLLTINQARVRDTEGTIIKEAKNDSSQGMLKWRQGL